MGMTKHIRNTLFLIGLASTTSLSAFAAAAATGGASSDDPQPVSGASAPVAGTEDCWALWHSGRRDETRSAMTAMALDVTGSSASGAATALLYSNADDRRNAIEALRGIVTHSRHATKLFAATSLYEHGTDADKLVALSCIRTIAQDREHKNLGPACRWLFEHSTEGDDDRVLTRNTLRDLSLLDPNSTDSWGIAWFLWEKGDALDRAFLIEKWPTALAAYEINDAAVRHSCNKLLSTMGVVAA